MGQVLYVHVVDPNRGRGREIAHHLSARSFCVEVHDGLSGLLSRARCGVILMSDDHEGTDPVKALEAIAGCAGYLPAALFSSSLLPHRVVRAMSAGVVDYFEWPCGVANLGEIVVRLIVQGERRVTVETLKAHARDLVARLSEREQAVLRCVVAGSCDKQVACALGISPQAAELHRTDMMRRLEAGSMSDAVRIGIYAGLDKVERDSGRTATRPWALLDETAMAG